jgi:hypothetical protein
MQEYKPNTGKNLIEVGVDKYGREFIRVYDKFHYGYHKYKNCKQMISELGLAVPRKDMKSCYKEAGDKFGMSPAAALKWYNAISYKTFVGSIDNQHVRNFALCWMQKGVKPQALNRLRRVADKLDQVKKDGIYNVAPLVYASERSPQELKAELGKGLWKKLHKNSFSRNKLLSFASIRDKDAHEDIPSSLLHLLNSRNFPVGKDTILYIKDKLKGSWTNKDRCKMVANLHEDTKRLSRILNREMSKNWSVDRLKEEHDRMIQLYNNQNRIREQARQSRDLDDPIEYEDNPMKSYEKNEYTAIRLNSIREYHKEGQDMEHCVGFYGNQAAEGTYICYQIRKDGEHYSTLGIMRHQMGKKAVYTFNQHYKKHNHEVDLDSAEEFATMLIGELNKASHSQFANSEQTVKE